MATGFFEGDLDGPAQGFLSLFLEFQSPNIPRAMHDPHDDDFGLRKPVVQRVGAMRVYTQPLGQVVPARTYLRVLLYGFEAILDLADQL